MNKLKYGWPSLWKCFNSKIFRRKENILNLNQEKFLWIDCYQVLPILPYICPRHLVNKHWGVTSFIPLQRSGPARDTGRCNDSDRRPAGKSFSNSTKSGRKAGIVQYYSTLNFSGNMRVGESRFDQNRFKSNLNFE